MEGTFRGRPDIQDRVRAVVSKFADRVEAADFKNKKRRRKIMAKDELVFRFNEKHEERLEYEDKLPEGVTEEDVQAKFGKLVWCEFYD